MEEVKQKVKEVKNVVDFQTTLIGDLEMDQVRQDSNVVPRLEKLEKLAKLCKLKKELKELQGDEKPMSEINQIEKNIVDLKKQMDIEKAGKDVINAERQLKLAKQYLGHIKNIEIKKDKINVSISK